MFDFKTYSSLLFGAIMSLLMVGCSKEKKREKFCGDYAITDLIETDYPSPGYYDNIGREYYIVITEHPESTDSIIIHQFGCMGSPPYVYSWNYYVTAFIDDDEFFIPEQHPVSTHQEMSNNILHDSWGNIKKDSIFFNYSFTIGDTINYYGNGSGIKF